MDSKKRFTVGEEIANTVSHGLGVAFSIVGLVLLVVIASKSGGVRQVASVSVFGATMIVLYLSSTFNHGLRHGKAKEFFHNFDQVAIFLLIAGTYTPIALIGLHGDWGWTLFTMQWGLAITGIVVKFLLPNKFEKGVNLFFVLSYIVMGWMLLIFILPIIRNIPTMGVVFILAGGVCYTFGTIFFGLKKLPYAHLVWHLFVLGGTTFHWIAIIYYILPGAN